MTPENVTVERLSTLSAELIEYNSAVHRLAIASIRGDITPKYAAEEVNRIIAEINQLTK